MKVAVVHEWLVTKAGSEAVVERILRLYPQADVYVLVDFMKRPDRDFLDGHRVFTSFLQKFPAAAKKYRGYLPLMPFAVEQHDLTGYDLVISSSHAVAKGVITGPDQLHVSYVHSPIRYAWDLQHTYLREAGLDRGAKGWLARLLLHYIRVWDTRTGNGVDRFVANSAFIGRRIRKIYGRESEVIHPPVDLDAFVPGGAKEDFYLAASRFVPYKKMPLIVKAFSRMPEKKLVVIGTGPEEAAARAVAGPNVAFLGFQPRPALIDHMQRARAFVFAAEEDFGIISVEAQGCGTPVIAYGKGGTTETVVEGETGVLFPEQTEEALIEAVGRFEGNPKPFDSAAIRRNAERFRTEVFDAGFKAAVDRYWRAHRPGA